jgi:glucosamine-6-phosphate deaminase
MTDSWMRVRRFATAESAAHALAREVVRSLVRQPDLVLGLPTGHTPLPVYRALIALHTGGTADFSHARTFNLDEFVGVAGRDPRSYRAFMHRHLFNHVNVPRAHRHFLNGAARDLDEECLRYERAIRRAGGLDLLMLGVGENGHIGFNEPGAALAARTHRTPLKPSTREANREWFGGRRRDVPQEALSMGMATIFAARRIVLLATGRRKAAIVAQLVNGPVTTRVPASLLQLHPQVEIWLDREAASALGS